MIRWIQGVWWKRQRAVDMAILWPACKAQAPDIDHARAAFAVHAFNDPAWVRHYGEAGLCRVIEELS